MSLLAQGSFGVRFTVRTTESTGQVSDQVIEVLGRWATRSNGSIYFENVTTGGFNDDTISPVVANGAIILRGPMATEFGGEFRFTKTS
jgi:hypothetical protein